MKRQAQEARVLRAVKTAVLRSRPPAPRTARVHVFAQECLPAARPYMMKYVMRASDHMSGGDLQELKALSVNGSTQITEKGRTVRVTPLGHKMRSRFIRARHRYRRASSRIAASPAQRNVRNKHVLQTGASAFHVPHVPQPPALWHSALRNRVPYRDTVPSSLHEIRVYLIPRSQNIYQQRRSLPASASRSPARRRHEKTRACRQQSRHQPTCNKVSSRIR